MSTSEVKTVSYDDLKAIFYKWEIEARMGRTTPSREEVVAMSAEDAATLDANFVWGQLSGTEAPADWILCDGRGVPDFQGNEKVDCYDRAGVVVRAADTARLSDCSNLFCYLPSDDFHGDILAWRPASNVV